MNKKGFMLIDCLLSMSFICILIICLFNSTKVNVELQKNLKNTNDEVRKIYE